jgi:hypothetical protein
MLVAGEWDEHFGELVQAAFGIGVADAATVVLDSSERPPPGEERAGAAPLEVLHIFIEDLTAVGEAVRLAGLLHDAAVGWIRRNRGQSGEEVSVKIYGPDGEVIKSVLVDPEGHHAIGLSG